MFENITTRHDGADATIEILAMLLGAFVFGYLLRHVLTRSSKSTIDKLTNNNEALKREIDSLRAAPGAALVEGTSTDPTADDELETQILHLESRLDRYRARLASAHPVGDDLKLIEGIGPKIEALLNASGIHTWGDLAATELDRLHKILRDAGERFRMHDPSTWPYQASLAEQGQWEQLKSYKQKAVKADINGTISGR